MSKKGDSIVRLEKTNRGWRLPVWDYPEFSVEEENGLIILKRSGRPVFCCSNQISQWAIRQAITSALDREMKRVSIVQTNCRRCGKSISSASGSFYGAEDRICENCITDDEKDEIVFGLANAILRKIA